MFQDTKEKYLYYHINNNYYKIPTFNKIVKIIDFARSTFKFKNKWIFSDVFHEDGEASGQYSYPKDGTLNKCEHKPNFSFDLVRLITTVIDRMDNVPSIQNIVKEWTKTDNGSYVVDDDDDFDLYIEIAQCCHNAIPKNVIKSQLFNSLKINKNQIPNNKFVYYF
tara:strand:- start:3807 stop:4301 length:495 start_codon:yes stop_codon:yes gene_type:complete